jgi:prepilin-type N-terminal cleavage/methylation domain-containing protein
MAAKDAGFTLVEAIAALAVAGLAAAGLMAALGSARARTVEAETRAEAVVLAKAVLDDALRAERLVALPRRGETGEPPISWTITVGDRGAAWPDVIAIDVTVRWIAAGKEHAFTLSGYRPALGP